MMRIALTIVLLGMAVFLTGCLVVPSLHPFYTDKDVVFEPALVGSWQEYQVESGAPPPAIPQVWAFSKNEGTDRAPNGYDLSVSVKDYTASYQAYLVKVGDSLFLDLLPNGLQTPEIRTGSDAKSQQSPEEEAGSNVQMLSLLHYVPSHSIWRARLNGNELEIATLDEDWVTQQVQEKTLGLRYETVQDTTVLTASPEELREFLLKHAHDDKAFPDPWTYRRQKPTPPEPQKEAPRF
jgi:hypothetical protein